MDKRRIAAIMVFVLSSMLLFDAWQAHQMDNQQRMDTTRSGQLTNPGRPSSARQPVVTAEQSVPQASTRLSSSNIGQPNEVVVPTITGETLEITTDLVKAVIDLTGGKIIHLELLQHKMADDKAQNVVLIDSAYSYRVQMGLTGEYLPNHNSTFVRVDDGPTRLTPGNDRLTVTLRAEGETGVIVDRSYQFNRDDYRIRLDEKITNQSSTTLENSNAYYEITRNDADPAEESTFLITFTGPAIYTEENKFQKIATDDIDPRKASHVQQANQDGWVAMVQHYFVSSLYSQQPGTREFYTRTIAPPQNSQPGVYAVGMILGLEPLAPGDSTTVESILYSGPQEQGRLQQAVNNLKLVVDYGWLTILAAPLFTLLQWLHSGLENWGWAIVALTILIKLAFFPLSAKSYRSMAQMRVLAPRMQALKERYGDDRQKMQVALTEMYRTEKINPVSGCLPILVQIPVFLALYWVLIGAVEMRDAPWIGWISDLASPDPFYILPVLMMATMLVQTWLNPTPADPMQAKLMWAMPVVFGVMFFFFPSGLVLYWTVSNLLTIVQQWYINRTIEKDKQRKQAS